MYSDGMMTSSDRELQWKSPGRGVGIYDVPGLKIFDKIDPFDVNQGGIGNCWLLSAISSLAEFPGAIKKLFKRSETELMDMPKSDQLNRYVVKLYDLPTFTEVEVEIDEKLATTEDGRLLAAKPSSDNELWACYLEKAVAKHCGGWDHIDGGNPTRAWALLTGCKEQYTIQTNNEGEAKTYKCFGTYNPNTKEWEVLANSPKDEQGFRALWPMRWPKVGASSESDRDMHFALSQQQLFDRMCAWDRQNYIVGAATRAGSDSESVNGMVDGHAYSVIDCLKEKDDAGNDLQLLKVRNPHGENELESGLWNDTGKGWDENPQLKGRLKPRLDKNDGIFWMTSDEFFYYFPTVYLCALDMTEFKED